MDIVRGSVLVDEQGDSAMDNANNAVRVNAVSGTVAATQSGVWTVQPGNTANTSPWLITEFFSTRSDTYTQTGNGVTVDVSATPMEYYAVQVNGTDAAATGWTAVLEGSLDGTNFTTILSHATATGDGAVLWSGTNVSPCLYFRSRVSALTLGSATNIVVTILGDQ